MFRCSRMHILGRPLLIVGSAPACPHQCCVFYQQVVSYSQSSAVKPLPLAKAAPRCAALRHASQAQLNLTHHHRPIDPSTPRLLLDAEIPDEILPTKDQAVLLVFVRLRPVTSPPRARHRRPSLRRFSFDCGSETTNLLPCPSLLFHATRPLSPPFPSLSLSVWHVTTSQTRHVGIHASRRTTQAFEDSRLRSLPEPQDQMRSQLAVLQLHQGFTPLHPHVDDAEL